MLSVMNAVRTTPARASRLTVRGRHSVDEANSAPASRPTFGTAPERGQVDDQHGRGPQQRTDDEQNEQATDQLPIGELPATDRILNRLRRRASGPSPPAPPPPVVPPNASPIRDRTLRTQGGKGGRDRHPGFRAHRYR